MRFKFNIKREVKIVVAILVVGGTIAFTERRQSTAAVNDITIKILNVDENHFLEENDIADLMQLDRENLKGASLNRINMREVEQKIKRESFVKDAQLYSDLKGNLVVRAELRRPIARIIRNDGPDGYIAEDGTIMPISSKYTARVLLISGAHVRELLKVKNLNDSRDGKELIQFLTTIRDDEFWSAQIAQLDIDAKERITIFPQVGDEVIEFGRPTDIETKLRKLMIFYKEILPRVGWSKYDRVNLEYEGQIVAE